MAMDFLDGIVVYIKTHRKIVSETIERRRLQTGGAPDPERIADNDEREEERNDEEIGKTLGEGDGCAYGYRDGGVT